LGRGRSKSASRPKGLGRYEDVLRMAARNGPMLNLIPATRHRPLLWPFGAQPALELDDLPHPAVGEQELLVDLPRLGSLTTEPAEDEVSREAFAASGAAVGGGRDSDLVVGHLAKLLDELSWKTLVDHVVLSDRRAVNWRYCTATS
jgi:hypothetical protein